MSKIALPSSSTMLTVGTATQSNVIDGLQAMLNWMSAIDIYYWNPLTAITLGQTVVIQSKGPGWTAVCTQAGTTGSGEPTWGAGTGNAITGDGSVNWTVYNVSSYNNLPAGSVTAAQIASLTITAAQIANNTITALNLANNIISTSQIAQGYGIDKAGDVKMFAGPKANIQTGWLYCDGSAVLKATYPALWTSIGATWGTVTSGMIPGGASTGDYFLLPDLRGVTVRGVSDGRQVGGVTLDPGRALGTYQPDGIVQHTHPFAHQASKNSISAGSGFNPYESGSGSGTGNNTVNGTGANETRMMNEALYFIVCAGAY
jgi:microcystin-dependent protein